MKVVVTDQIRHEVGGWEEVQTASYDNVTRLKINHQGIDVYLADGKEEYESFTEYKEVMVI